MRPAPTVCALEYAPCALKYSPCALEYAPCALEYVPCALEYAPCTFEIILVLSLHPAFPSFMETNIIKYAQKGKNNLLLLVF